MSAAQFGIVTKADLLAAQARGDGPLAEAVDDEPVFLLRAADFESQTALWHFANTGHHRWRQREWGAWCNTVLLAMKQWFDAREPKLPRAFREEPRQSAAMSGLGGGVRKWKRQ